MNNTVQTIIDMDKAARNRKAEAVAKADGILKEAEEKRTALKKSAAAKTEAESSRICQEIKADSDREIARVKAETDEKCRRLDEVIGNNADLHMTEIINNIFGGTDE